jgi:hypothetical protein
VELLFLLLAAHAMGDFGLQTDWVAQYKSRHIPPPEGAKSKRPDLIWIHVLSAHCIIHGGMVAVITGFWWLGLAEFIAHWVIDFGKGEKWFGFHTDQFLHIACKLIWFGICIGIGIES